MNNKKTTFFVVGAVEKDHFVDILSEDRNIDLKWTNGMVIDLRWTNGMVGVMPVFEDEALARKYAGNKFKVFRLEIIKGD